jgi:hypothetical protein
MKLFQYWDTPVPPPDVAQWVEDCRDRNPEFEHVLLNEATAQDFIARHYGPRELRAFRSCAVPAMQADLIRLCVIDTMGGIYLDADSRCVRPLSELIATAPHAMMMTFMHSLINGFLMFRQPHHAFIRCCLALALDNIEARRFRNVATSTGPGIFTALRDFIAPSSLEQAPAPEVVAAWKSKLLGFIAQSQSQASPTPEIVAAVDWDSDLVELAKYTRSLIVRTPELVAAFESVTIMDTLAAARWIVHEQARYKQTELHWLNWKGDIYR